jgi:hypothetical protein
MSRWADVLEKVRGGADEPSNSTCDRRDQYESKRSQRTRDRKE